MARPVTCHGHRVGLPRPFPARKALQSRNSPYPGYRRRTRCIPRTSPPVTVESQAGGLDDGALVPLELGDVVVGEEEEATVQRERQKALWRKALKIPFFWVGTTPVTVGASLAYFEHGKVSLLQTSALLVAAILIIGWLNLSNDAFDAETGVDEAKAESFVNLTGNRHLILAISVVIFIVGAGLLAASLGTLNQPIASALLTFSIACGYVYQGPPFRWSYKGWGEPLCFFAFGPSATTAFYLALSPCAVALREVPMTVWVSSVLVGITTTVILFCSHFHQHDGDKAAGKLSPIVKLGGPAPAIEILRWAAKLPFILLPVAAIARQLPWEVLVCCGVIAFPRAKDVISFAQKNHENLKILPKLKMVAIKLHCSFGLALCLGLVLARRLAL